MTERLYLGYALDMPGRPRAQDQINQQKLLRTSLSFMDSCAYKRGRPPRWEDRLNDRQSMLEATDSDTTVVVSSPFCLGATAADLEQFLPRLFAKGAQLIICDPLQELSDIHEIVERARRQIAAGHMRMWRSRHSP
jgi:hypothetical protein